MFPLFTIVKYYLIMQWITYLWVYLGVIFSTTSLVYEQGNTSWWGFRCRYLRTIVRCNGSHFTKNSFTTFWKQFKVHFVMWKRSYMCHQYKDLFSHIYIRTVFMIYIYIIQGVDVLTGHFVNFRYSVLPVNRYHPLTGYVTFYTT